MKRYYCVILAVSVCLSFTLKINGSYDGNLSNQDPNYNWDENKARREIRKQIKDKFGSESMWGWWPFMSKEEEEKIKTKNKEIKHIKQIAEKELKSPDNYKRLVSEESRVRYETRVVRKPVQRVITEWKEVVERVPVRERIKIRKKFFSGQRIKNRVFATAVNFISKKSYEAAMKKTGNPVIADIVKTEISKEVMRKMSSAFSSLSGYVGKEREKKIDQIIKRVRRRENIRAENLNPHIPSAPPYEP